MALFRLVILLLWPAHGLAQQTEVVLSPGEEIVVELAPSLDAVVSRKGVIDLQNTDAKSWIIRGLRAGVVVVRWYDPNGVEAERRLVNVVNTDKKMGRFPDWCCELAGVECDRRRRRIAGNFSDAGDWLQAKSWCQAHDDCWFQADLAAREHARASMMMLRKSRMSGRWDVLGRQLIYKGYCTEAIKDKLTKNLGSLADAVDGFDCAAGDIAQYRIRMKLVAMSAETVKRSGIEVQRRPILPASSDPWTVVLKRLGSQDDVRLVGEPSLLVQKGGSAQMSSGGEFRVFYDSSGEEGTIREGWKRYGLSFNVKPADKLGLGEKIIVQLRLTSPGSASNDNLGSYSVESQIPLTDGGQFLLSLSTFERFSRGDRSEFDLTGIPILGPLFRVMSRDHTEQFLAIWAFVDLVED